MWKQRVLVVALASLLCVTAAQASFFDGFESGDMSNWYVPYGWATHMEVLTSADNGNVLPHSGNYLAYQGRNYGSYWPQDQHDISPAANGIVTAYINPIAFSDDFLFSFSVLGNHGEMVRFMNGGTNGREIRLYSPGLGNYYPGITITDHVWHELKFDVQPTGTNVYWDGALIQANNPDLFDVAGINFGTGWGSAAVAYDDISFVIPEPMTLVLLGLGAVGLIRRK